MIAFLFPGQGSQAIGMGKALADAFPESCAVFEEADAALGEPLSDLIFNGPEDRLTLTENTQPAILTASIAAFRALEARGCRPAIVAGHSLGEYSAHVAAGTLAFRDAVRLVRNRGRYMQEATPVGSGAMAAILGLDPAGVEQACRDAATAFVEIGPGVVLSGLAKKAARDATILSVAEPADVAAAESLCAERNAVS